MNTLLTEEEHFVQKLARDFLEKESSPDLARAMEKDPRGYDPDLWQKISDLGWARLVIPSEFGGIGAPITQLGLIVEEAGRAISPIPLRSSTLAAMLLCEAGSETQKLDFMPAVCEGKTILSWAMTEHDPRLAPDAIEALAVRNGDDYVLTGTKMFVENFEASDYCLAVFRTSEPQADTPEFGLTLFLVEKDAPDLKSIPLTTVAKDAQSKLIFNGVRVPAENVVGELDTAWPFMVNHIDRAISLLCAELVGMTRKDMELAVAYAKQRSAFGRTIGSFQSIAHVCADMLIWIDAAELLTHEAIWRISMDLPASIEASQAKAFCNEKCLNIARYAQMIHGGIGFLAEFDLQLWYRRIAGNVMRMGTAFEHRKRIASFLLDRPGVVRLGTDLYDLKHA